MEDGVPCVLAGWEACEETGRTVCEILMSTCHFLHWLGLGILLPSRLAGFGT